MEINPNLFTKEVLNKFFPRVYLRSSEVYESEGKFINSFSGEISSYNLFNQTLYEYKGRNLFLHFTKIENLLKIIESGNLWMSTLDSLEDEEELHYAGRYLDSNYRSELSSACENLFSLSACESTEVNIQSEHMWTHYGGNHSGCIIEYSFTLMDIYKMNFGHIRYGDSELKELDHISRLSNEFFSTFGYKVSNLPLFLRKILAFHKTDCFQLESEIRLLFEPDIILPNERFEYISCDKKGYRRVYKLPFKERNKLPENPNFDLETKLHHYPQIELKRVVLGQKTSITGLKEIKKLIQEKFQNCECIKL